MFSYFGLVFIFNYNNWFLLCSSWSYSFFIFSLSQLKEKLFLGARYLQNCRCIIIFFLIEIPCVILSTVVSGAVYRIRVSKGVVFCIKKTDWSVDGVRLSGFGYELDIWNVNNTFARALKVTQYSSKQPVLQLLHTVNCCLVWHASFKKFFLT